MLLPVTLYSRNCVACDQGGWQWPLTLCWVHARMVDAGDIFARIDAAPGMVRFLEDPEAYDSGAAVARIDHAVQRSMALSQRLQAAHRAVRPGLALGAHGQAFVAGHGLARLLDDALWFVCRLTCDEVHVVTMDQCICMPSCSCDECRRRALCTLLVSERKAGRQ